MLMQNWQPPAHWQQITAIDAHTAGEPLRIITSGFPELPGSTILEKRQFARQHYDHVRRALMWGHGIIGLVKVGVETGAFPAQGSETIIKIDTPAGRVTATAHLDASGRVE